MPDPLIIVSILLVPLDTGFYALKVSVLIPGYTYTDVQSQSSCRDIMCGIQIILLEQSRNQSKVYIYDSC